MELGISTWSLPWSIGVPGYPKPPTQLDAFAMVTKAAEHGVPVLQIADNLPLHELSGPELNRLKMAAVAEGVMLELGTRGLDKDRLVRYVRIAEHLGARALRTVISGSMCNAAELTGAEAAINDVLDVLEQRNVRLAIENNESFSAAQFSDLVQRVSSPFVGICLDTANSLGRPEPLETVVNQLGSHTIMLHAKDYDIKRVDTRMGFSVIGRPAGDGRVDFDALLRELRNRGRHDISVIVEHWPPFEGTIEATMQLEEDWLAKSIAFLRDRVGDH